MAAILKTLPTSGQLFPALAQIHEAHRAKLFIKRLASVGITGVSLHSFRYAWAERAKEVGHELHDWSNSTFFIAEPFH